MRSNAGAFWRALATLVLVASIAAPARADLVPLGPAREIFFWPGILVNAYVAFDEVNQVYLVVWGTSDPQPCRGIVLNAQGQPISGVFSISDGQAPSAWPRVAAGGGRFLVTYTKRIAGTAEQPVTQQMARFVTVANGVPHLASGEILLDALGRVGSDAGTVYVPAQNAFLATWWKWGALPQSFIRRVNVDGTVGPIHQLTDNTDGQSDPEIACDNSGTCLAIGFAWDTAHLGQGEGATWSRLVDAATGAPVAPLRYLDIANRQEAQTIAFSPATNRYTAAWVRTHSRVIIGQAVDTSGNPLGLYTIKAGLSSSCHDFGYGQTAASLTYNAGSGTIAIGIVDWCGFAYVQELDGAGLPIEGQFHLVSGLLTENNQPTIGVNAGAAQFLFIHNFNHAAPRGRLYQAKAIDGGGGGGGGGGGERTTIDLTAEGAPNGSWFMAEGVASPTPFHTFYLVSNENPKPVTVRAYFANGAGTVQAKTFDVAARSRYTVNLETEAGMGSFSSVFQSLTPGQDILVERSVYFGPNLEGSTVGTATKSLSATWHFAEGSRGGEYFANYFMLFNPSQTPINVTATFYPSHGDAAQRTYTIAPQSRFTVGAIDIPELANKDFSTSFVGDAGFVAERGMYWGNPWHGGTVSMGATNPYPRWLFAEGVANPLMETFYLILNPNDYPIEVTANYFPEFSAAFSQTYTIQPRARHTVYLNGEFDNIGPAAAEFTSQAYFLAERSIYWGHRVEGTNVIGVNTPAMVWSLPEGADGGAFDTYTLIANPNWGDVKLDVTFYFDDGTQVTVPDDLRPTVPARGRLTMDMGSYWLPLLSQWEGRDLTDKSFSTRISVFQQAAPVVVEHALYWNFVPGLLWRSGGAAVGIPH